MTKTPAHLHFKDMLFGYSVCSANEDVSIFNEVAPAAFRANLAHTTRPVLFDEAQGSNKKKRGDATYNERRYGCARLDKVK